MKQAVSMDGESEWIMADHISGASASDSEMTAVDPALARSWVESPFI